LAGLLIVDDEFESRQSIRAFVESSKHNYMSINEADTFEKGLLLLKQTKPSVLIVEISLPDNSGVDLGKTALEWYPNLSVIVITHLKMFELVQKCINFGFSAFLLKPVSKSELNHVLDRLSENSLSIEANQMIENNNSQEIAVDPANPIKTAIKFIQTHYREPITLREIADFVYLSPSHFSRLFKEETGETFIEYVTRYRLEQSKGMLKMTSLPVEVIAHKMGFTSSAYFATTFKRSEGRTPTEYRNLFLNLSDAQN
jgi:two-component system response regulator YesN